MRRGFGGRELSPSYGTAESGRRERRDQRERGHSSTQAHHANRRGDRFWHPQQHNQRSSYEGGRGSADFEQRLLAPDGRPLHPHWSAPPAILPYPYGYQMAPHLSVQPPGTWAHFAGQAAAYPAPIPQAYGMAAPVPQYASTELSYGGPASVPAPGPGNGRVRQRSCREEEDELPPVSPKERRMAPHPEPDMRGRSQSRGREEVRRGSRAEESSAPSRRTQSSHKAPGRAPSHPNQRAAGPPPGDPAASIINTSQRSSRVEASRPMSRRSQSGSQHSGRDQSRPTQRAAGPPLGDPAASLNNTSKGRTGETGGGETRPPRTGVIGNDPGRLYASSRSRSRSSAPRAAAHTHSNETAAGAPSPAASIKSHTKNPPAEVESGESEPARASSSERRFGAIHKPPMVRNSDPGGRPPLVPQPVSDDYKKVYQRHPGLIASSLQDGVDKGVWLFVPNHLPLRQITDLPLYHQDEKTLEVVRELLGVGPHVRLAPAARVSDRTDGRVEKRTYFFPNGNYFKSKLAAPSQLNLHILQLAHPGTRIFVRKLKSLDRRYDDGTLAWTFQEAVLPSAAAPDEVHYLLPAIAVVAKLDSPDDNLRSVEQEDGFARDGLPRYKSQTNYLVCFQAEEAGHEEPDDEDGLEGLAEEAGAMSIKPELEDGYDFEMDEEVGVAESQEGSPGQRGYPAVAATPNPLSQLPIRRKGIRGYAVLRDRSGKPPLADEAAERMTIEDGDCILVHSMKRMNREEKEHFRADNDYLPLVPEDELFSIASWAKIRPDALRFWDLREPLLRPGSERQTAGHRFDDAFYRVCQAQALGLVATAHEELLEAMQMSPPIFDVPYSWAIQEGHVQLSVELSEEQRHSLRGAAVSKLELRVLKGGEPHLTGRLIRLNDPAEDGAEALAVYRIDDSDAEKVERACIQITRRHWPRRGRLNILPNRVPNKERRRHLTRGLFRVLMGKAGNDQNVGRQLASIPVPGEGGPPRKEVRPLPPYLEDPQEAKELLGHPLSSEQRAAISTIAAANDRAGNRVVLVEGRPGSAKTYAGALASAVRLNVDENAEILYVAKTNEAAREGYNKLKDTIIPALEKKDPEVRQRVRPLLAPAFSRELSMGETPSPESRTLPAISEHIYRVWETCNQPESEEGLAAFGEALLEIKYPWGGGEKERESDDFATSRNQVAECCASRHKYRRESEEAYEALECEEESQSLVSVGDDAGAEEEPAEDVDGSGLMFREEDTFNGIFGISVRLGLVERDLQAAVAVLLKPNFICATLDHARRYNLWKMGLRPTILVIDEGSLLRLRDVLHMVDQVGPTCQSVVILGDQRQIPPYSRSKGAMRLHEQQSVLETVGNRRGLPTTVQRLLTSFRLPADLNSLNNVFYDQPGGCGSNWVEDTDPLHRFPLIRNSSRAVIVDVDDGIQQLDGYSFYSLREIELAIKSMQLLIQAGVPKNEVFIGTPYEAQRCRLEAAVKALGLAHTPDNPGVRVKTVDTCIGLEAPYVILSMVRGTPEDVCDNRLHFLSDPCKYCVGASRAMRVLIMLVNMNTVVRGLESLGKERVSAEGQDALTRILRFFWQAHNMNRVLRGVDFSRLLYAAKASLDTSPRPEEGFNSPYNTWPARHRGSLNEGVQPVPWSYNLIPRLRTVLESRDWFARQFPLSVWVEKRDDGASGAEQRGDGAEPVAGPSQPMEQRASASDEPPKTRQWVPSWRGRGGSGPSGRGSGGPGRGGFRGSRGGRGRGGPRPGSGGY